MDVRSSLDRTRHWFRSLFTNRYFWSGLAVLGVLALGLYLLFNHVIMPSYTRHGVTATVPDVVGEPFVQARQTLRAQGFEVGKNVATYTPNVPQDAVTDQNPPPLATVKPGRRVYLTVNSGERPMVQIPRLQGASIRQAKNRLQAPGLVAEDVRPDSIPSPYANTITRQTPPPGDSLPRGAGVILWYSTGLGDTYVTIPDVTGMTVEAAQDTLLARSIRSVVVGAEEDGDIEEDAAERTVTRQSREPGTRVREGFEVRLFVE